MRIVVATDGSRGGRAALRFAARLAGKDPATELIVVMVGGGEAEESKARVPADSNNGRRRAQKVFDGAQRELEGRNIRAEYRFVPQRASAPIPEAISREADRLRADLVVVGSEGRDTIGEWVVGGVALRLIYVAQRPVAVVRPPRRTKTARDVSLKTA
jgi:nucleotide-binding universal stress UspA family protein